jgi:hypothetical protein
MTLLAITRSVPAQGDAIERFTPLCVNAAPRVRRHSFIMMLAISAVGNSRPDMCDGCINDLGRHNVKKAIAEELAD